MDRDTGKLVEQGAKVVLGQPDAYSCLIFEGDGGAVAESTAKHPPFRGTTGQTSWISGTIIEAILFVVSNRLTAGEISPVRKQLQ